MIVSGLRAEEDQPKYTRSYPTTSLAFVTEKAASQTAANSERDSVSGKYHDDPKKPRSKAPRSTVISAQQKALLKSHLDEIRDVCILERPVGMSVSVDRQGVIYVFQ